jgi:tetratricopeptide (TPR) repeat protein
MTRFALVILLILTCTITACSKKAPEITSLQRKEAANLVSEAQFAVALRDRARAEELLTKAVALCPDEGSYWLDLGSIRRGLENKDGARQAYAAAAKAYAAAYKADRKQLQPLLQQIYVEALLGNTKAAQKLRKQAVSDHPDNPAAKKLTPEWFDAMLADPNFKALAL